MRMSSPLRVDGVKKTDFQIPTKGSSMDSRSRVFDRVQFAGSRAVIVHIGNSSPYVWLGREASSLRGSLVAVIQRTELPQNPKC